MPRTLSLIGTIGLLLVACQREPPPTGERFRFPVGIFIQAKRNDFWEAFEAGLMSRFDTSIPHEIVYFDTSRRPDIAQQMTQPGKWRALAFCAPPDEWTRTHINKAVREGTPLVLVGVDMRNTLRLATVSTYYYDAGRKAGAWYARHLPSGRIVLIAGHPVPRAVSEFWDGFRHGLLENRRLQVSLIPLNDSTQMREAIAPIQLNPQVRGVFLMGAEVAEQAIGLLPPQNLGVFSWRESARTWYHEKRCQLVLIESPREIGVRTANLLRNLSIGRGKDYEVVFIPYEMLAH